MLCMSGGGGRLLTLRAGWLTERAPGVNICINLHS